MPTCVSIDGDLVSVEVDRASTEETIAMVLLRRGGTRDLERAALALRSAQRHLAAAEIDLIARANAAALAPILKRRKSRAG